MPAISVLLASGGLLAGCGSGGHAASTAARTTRPSTARTAPAGGAGASRTTGAGPLARARAKAFARAVNLRAADLPGFRASSEREQHAAGEKRLERELVGCVGSAGASRGLVESGSGTFERHASIVSQSVSSEVTVAQTPAQAAKELAAFHSGRLTRCLSHYFTGLLGSQKYHGAIVSPVSTKQGSPPAPGATGSFGLRFRATVTLHAIAIPLYVDILGFVDGSAEVSLFATGIPAPFPAAIEEHVFTLLLKRAKTHKI
ncbi:MAG: hypothetical protein ACLQBY_12175 [Solirubrobacteraceae bacterium]